MNIKKKCILCKKKILSNEYFIYQQKIICIFCIDYNTFKKLNIIKFNKKCLLEFKLNKINKIGIIGKICSGKTFVANYLVDKYNFTKYSFASPLKKIAKDYYNMKNKDRILLQDLAIKMKDIDKNVFVNYFLNNYNKYDNVVIDDLRFSNELMELKKNNFTIIKINIHKDIQLNRYKTLYNDNIERLNHISELEQDNFSNNLIDYVLESNDDILNNIDKILNNYSNNINPILSNKYSNDLIKINKINK